MELSKIPVPLRFCLNAGRCARFFLRLKRSLSVTIVLSRLLVKDPARPPSARQPRLPQESQGPRHPARRGSTRRIRQGTEHLRPRRVSPGTNYCWRIWRDVIARRPPCRCNCGALSYYGDRSSKTVKAYYRRVIYRAWGLTAHRGWARLMLDRRSLVQAPSASRDQSQHPRARNDYDTMTKRPLTIVI